MRKLVNNEISEEQPDSKHVEISLQKNFQQILQLQFLVQAQYQMNSNSLRQNA